MSLKQAVERGREWLKVRVETNSSLSNQLEIDGKEIRFFPPEMQKEAMGSY